MRVVPLAGAVDGSNKIFWTPSDYAPGSVRVVRSGLLLVGDAPDGWSELGGKKIEMKEPPEEGDVMEAFYLPI